MERVRRRREAVVVVGTIYIFIEQRVGTQRVGVTHINSSAHLVLPSKNSLDLVTRKSAKITFSCGSAEGGGHTY